MEVEISNIQALKEEMEVLRNSWDNLFAEASLIAEAMDMPRGFPVSHKRRRKRFKSILKQYFICGNLCVGYPL